MKHKRHLRKNSWEEKKSSLSNVAKIECTDSVETTMGYPALVKVETEQSLHKNVGMGKAASMLGCNTWNDNASARTLNSNNAVSNSNDNYAGAFALITSENNKYGIFHPTCSTRAKITEEVKLQGSEDVNPNILEGSLRNEYSANNMVASESSAFAHNKKTYKKQYNIWYELKEANKKRHLKNLKRFLVNETIVRAGVERCLENASKSVHRDRAIRDKEKIIARIIKEMTSETYKVGKFIERKLPKKGKDGKERNAKIFRIYDRCVENVILLIIQEKLTNKISRHIYSGVKKRSLFSNTKAYCLRDRLQTYLLRNQNDYIGITDIYHFYDTLKSEVVLRCLFKTIKDRYMKVILTDILSSTKTLPIGSTLSQLFAMVLLSECDDEIIKRFKPKFYAGFGDNRIFGDPDKDKIIQIRLFQKKYYKEKFELAMKDDYSLHKASDNFSFCKTIYCEGGKYVKIRGELKRRAIRAKIEGQQHYAGYKGFLLKTDSKKLRSKIEHGMRFLKKRISFIHNPKIDNSDGDKNH